MAILFSLDNSASMSDDCLDGRTKIKHATHTIVNILRLFAETKNIECSVSMNVFNHDVTQLFDFIEIKTGKLLDETIQKIENVYPVSCTNIEEIQSIIEEFFNQGFDLIFCSIKRSKRNHEAHAACITNQTFGAEVEAHWQRVQQTAVAADYLGALAPGSPCSEVSSACTVPQQTNNFAVLIAQVSAIDWLELGRAGHRRARLLQESWQWLTP